MYCCHACNEHKGNYWNPNVLDRILHPINDALTDQYTLQSDGTLSPLTDTGEFHISRLQLNRPALIHKRRNDLLEQQDRNERATIAETLRRIADILDILNRPNTQN